MNTKTTKFLAVLAVLAMAFAAFAITSNASQNDATATDILSIDNGTDVDFTYYITEKGTSSTVSTTKYSNEDLNNVFYVSENLKGTYAVYTVTGYFASIQATSSNLFGSNGLGMINDDSYGNMIVFNMTIPAGAAIWISGNSATEPSSWTSATKLASATATTEPNCFNAVAGETKWIGYSTADGATGPSVYAAIVFEEEGTYTHYGDSTDTLIVENKTAAVSASGDIVVIGSYNITSATTAAGLVQLASGKNLFVAPGATLTIAASGASPGTASHFNIIKAAGTAGSTTTKISGGVASAVRIVDSTTLSGDLSSGESCTNAINASGNLVIKDISLTITQSAEGTFGTNVAGTITIQNSIVSITSENRALYNQASGCGITIEDGSDVTLYANENALKSYFSGLTIGSEPVTVGEETTYDETIVRAYLNDGQTGNEDPEDFHGVKISGALTIYQGATLTTSDLEIVYVGASSVSGTLNILGSEYAGYVDSSENIWVPGGLVIAGTLESKKIATVESAVLTITSTGAVNISEGAAIFGSISDGATEASVATFGALSDTPATVVPSYVVASADSVLTHGSVNISGSWYTDSDGTIVVTGTAEIYGALDVDLVIEDEATVIVPVGETLEFDGITISGGTDSYLTILGSVSGTAEVDEETTGLTITANDPEAAADVIEGADIETATETVTTQEELEDLKTQYDELALGASFSISSDLELPSTLTLDMAGYTLTVNSGKELTLKGTKIIDSSTGTSGLIRVLGYLTLNSADVCANVTPYNTDGEEVGYITITGAKEMTVTGTLNSNLAVGYGNKLVVTDLTVPSGKKVAVFGEMTANGTLTVASGGKVTVNTYATAEINATTTVEGTFINNGYTTINGNVTVYKAAGGAVFTNNGYLIISTYSTFNVTAGKQADADENIFNAGYAYLYGTSTITGTMNGVLIDYGALIFNGTAGDSAAIQVRNGVEVSILSVSGTLTVTDDDAAIDDTWSLADKDYKSYVLVYDANYFVLTNVKGLTVTQKTVVTPSVINDVSVKYYVSTLTLTGTSSSVVKDTAHSIMVHGGVVEETYYYEDWEDSVSKGSASVGDLTVGKYGYLSFVSGNKKVIGTVQAQADYSEIDFTYSDTTKTTISGTVYTNDKGNSYGIVGYAGKVSAAYYEVTDSEGYVHEYLTTFKAALDVISDVDDKAIILYGTQRQAASASYEIPADATVSLYSDCTLTINGNLTVAKDGTLDGSAAKIVVKGLLTVQDKNTGLKYNTTAGKFVYQVYTENGDTVKYAGIARAIADSAYGDTITMVQDGTIDASTTIPEGVTVIVPNGITLTVGDDEDKVTLTINGILQMKRSGDVVNAGGKEVTFKVNGAIISDDADPEFDIDNFTATGYVKFATTIDGRPNTVYSNIEFAALTVTEGTVTVIGSVGATEVTFTTTGDDIINIVVAETDENDLQNVLAVGSLTLVDAMLTVEAVYTEDNPGVFTGSVTALSADDEATMTFVNATGFVIESDVTEVASGYKYAMNFAALTTQGRFVISDGTVYVDTAVWISSAESMNASLVIDEGAILIVPDEASLVYYASHATDDAYLMSNMFEIDGVLTAEEGSIIAINGADINGLFNVLTDKAGLTYSYINGTVLVLENEDDDSVLTVGEAVYVWNDANATGSAATISGAVTIDDTGVLIAYPSADISEAYINWNVATGESDAVSTEYYINEELYMTAFASQGTSVLALFPVYAENYDLIGLDCGVRTYNATPATGSAASTNLYNYANWYSDISMTPNTVMGSTAKIGQYDAFYAKAEASVVSGTITVGVGLNLYVDGVGYTASSSKVYELGVGVHSVYVEVQSGYVGDKVTIKFNDAPVSAGVITILPGMEDFTLVTTGAEPYTPEPTPEPEKESEWNVTTILLCVLVVLIAIMAVIVALRLNRN